MPTCAGDPPYRPLIPPPMTPVPPPYMVGYLWGETKGATKSKTKGRHILGNHANFLTQSLPQNQSLIMGWQYERPKFLKSIFINLQLLGLKFDKTQSLYKITGPFLKYQNTFCSQGGKKLVSSFINTKSDKCHYINRFTEGAIVMKLGMPYGYALCM